jgi:DNA-binding CsgD family transcriptional regulator
LGRGKSTREVADGLHLSVKTIETHRAHIKEKLGFKEAEELVKFAVEWVTAAEG